MVGLKTQQVKQPSSTGKQYALFVMRFLFVWLAALLVIAATGLALNLDWARPDIQRMLSQMLHRNVRLGRLSWNLGLNGLAIASRNLTVTDSDGKPFLSSDRSEIGVAFLPLTRGQLIIRYLDFVHPELWANRISANRWNFSDLLDAKWNIRFIQVEGGRCHIRDRQVPETVKATAVQPLSGHFDPYEVSDIRLKFIWPRSNHRWPFVLSCSLPRAGYVTHLRINALGKGRLRQWQDNRYNVSLSVSNWNPDDWRVLIGDRLRASSLVQLSLHGDGTVRRGLKGVISFSAGETAWQQTGKASLMLPAFSSSALFVLYPDRITWQDLHLKMRSFQLHGQCKISDWQNKDPDYALKLDGRVQDLKVLASILPVTQAGFGRANLQPEISAVLNDADVTGRSKASVDIEGDHGHPRYAVEVQAEDMAMGHLGDSEMLKRYPWLQLISDSSCRLKGTVLIQRSGVRLIPALDILTGHGTIHIAGYWNTITNQGKITFKGERISLEWLHSRLSATSATRGFFHRHRLSFPKAITGSADINGAVTGLGSRDRIKVSVNLHQAQVISNDSACSMQNLEGCVSYDGDRLRLQSVKGILGNGGFQIDGGVVLSRKPELDVRFQANSLNLDDLRRSLQQLSIQLPILSQRQIFGHVRSITLSLNGSLQSPVMSLNIDPDNLYYQPQGLSRPLHALSGKITYSGGDLALTDVELITGGSKLLTNLVINQLTSGAHLKRLRLRTSGADLNDIQFYLSSTFMPTELRTSYLDFVQRYHLKAIHGRILGDISWKPHHQDGELAGSLSLVNVGGKILAEGLPVDHLSARVSLSGSELWVSDVVANVGASRVMLESYITNYTQPGAACRTRLKAMIDPDNFLSLLPGLAGRFRDTVQSDGPLFLKAVIDSNGKQLGAMFLLRASPKDHLRIKTPICQVTQPPGKELSLSGLASASTGASGRIVLRNGRLSVASSILQTQGSYAWSGPSSKPGPTLEITLTAAKPFPASLLVRALDPNQAAEGISGQVLGTLTLKGPVGAITTDGALYVDGLSLPQYNLYRLTGSIESPDWPVSSIPSISRRYRIKPAEANLSFKSAALGNLVGRNIHAILSFQRVDGQSLHSRLALREGTASVADGHINLAGWVDLESHRMHLNLGLRQVLADQIVSELIGHQGEVTGVADADVNLDSSGIDYRELLKHLDGQGSFSISSGKVARFGQLQDRLTHATLVHEGLFGFNLNNLLQSVVPVRSGAFKHLLGSFAIADGVFSVTDLCFNGDDMRLRAAGLVNLPLNTMQLEVAGDVPRVATSLIGGPMGQMSRGITLERFFETITMHKLQSLPAFPVLGDIANDHPRVFAFRIAAPLDRPQLVAKSIEKSFHWLPVRPNATAHPLPGL